MTNPFANYAKAANTMVTQPAKLVGVNKTRAEARARYDTIVAELHACTNKLALQEYLEIAEREIAQFRAELEFYWEGEGDFLGLRKEIAWAQARVDAGLDFPRWEPASNSVDLTLFPQAEARN